MSNKNDLSKIKSRSEYDAVKVKLYPRDIDGYFDDGSLRSFFHMDKSSILAHPVEDVFFSKVKAAADILDFKTLELLLDPDIVQHICQSESKNIIGMACAAMSYPFLDDSDASNRAKEFVQRWNKAFEVPNEARIRFAESLCKNNSSDLKIPQTVIGLCSQVQVQDLDRLATTMTPLLINKIATMQFQGSNFIRTDYLDAFHPDAPPPIFAEIQVVDLSAKEINKYTSIEKVDVLKDCLFNGNSLYSEFFRMCAIKYGQKDDFIRNINESLLIHINDNKNSKFARYFLGNLIDSKLLEKETIVGFTQVNFTNQYGNDNSVDFIEALLNSVPLGLIVKQFQEAGLNPADHIIIGDGVTDRKRSLYEIAIKKGEVSGFAALLEAGADPHQNFDFKTIAVKNHENLFDDLNDLTFMNSSAAELIDARLVQSVSPALQENGRQMLDIIKAHDAKIAVGDVFAELGLQSSIAHKPA